MVNKEALVTSLYDVSADRRLIRQITTDQLTPSQAYEEGTGRLGCRHSTANGSMGHHHTSRRSDIFRAQIDYEGALGGGTPRNALHIPRPPRI